ncbi:MAG: divalent-cation tolerance protein CutA [Candidatus Marinimicrobia bacterium]|nr:divalent-cation tolerance protein CutA [Candidatus Neomarinimicrobiota bacterium]
MKFIQVQFTIDNKSSAEEIARTLIDEKMAACVQIVGPVTSIYRWQNKIEQSGEFLCLIKTEKSLYSRLEQRIKTLHHYKIPEIISIDIVDIESNYSKWIHDSLI